LSLLRVGQKDPIPSGADNSGGNVLLPATTPTRLPHTLIDTTAKTIAAVSMSLSCG